MLNIEKKSKFQVWKIYSIINPKNAKCEKKKKYMLKNTRSKRNMLDYNFEKNLKNIVDLL